MDPNIPAQPATQPTPKKKLPQWLTTVTLFSKLLAMTLFIALPFAGFYLGMKYQEKTTVTNPIILDVQKTSVATPTPTSSTNPLSTTSPDIDTSNWKTYISQNNVFSFKYPADMVFLEKDSNSDNFGITKKGSAAFTGKNVIFGHTIPDNQINNYLQVYKLSPSVNMVPSFSLFYGIDNDIKTFDITADFITISEDPTASIKIVTVGQDIKAQEYTRGCQSTCVDVYFSKNGEVLDFSDRNTILDLDTLHKILSTFKFTQ
jgi:hypothetical protein